LLAGGVLSEAACHVLADICSYGGGLPTGAPTSPALANLVLRSADTSIAKAARSNNITYTRYADDLTFSGESNVVKILPFVSRVLGQIGYQLDAKKTNIFRRGRRQMVTGLVVNVKPNLPRRIRRRLRAAVHHAVNGKQPTWQGGPMSKSGLLARLGHLALVQPVESAALRQLLKGSGNNGKSMQ
jgi:retron-type reverse transcriptase